MHKDQNIKGASLKAEEAFKNQYSAIYNHLLNYKNELSNRNQAETGIRYEWYALQRWGANYMDDFFRPKVMWKIIGSNINFCYDKNSHMCNNAVNIMIGNERELINFIGLMNSKLYNWYLKLTTTAEVQGGGVQLYSTVLENIPVNLNLPFEINEVIINRLNDKNLDGYVNNTLYNYFELSLEEIEFIEN